MDAILSSFALLPQAAVEESLTRSTSTSRSAFGHFRDGFGDGESAVDLEEEKESVMRLWSNRCGTFLT